MVFIRIIHFSIPGSIWISWDSLVYLWFRIGTKYYLLSKCYLL